ncbi:MAG: fused MFS/spermidine synthase [Deltaproteobacteria bacterium]|nr:fused MFS/spermidine synthase [Deltaproteobacteria bacterium]
MAELEAPPSGPLRPMVGLSLAFLSSASTMIVEVVAGRVVAADLGTSLYTWTAVIGTVLAGMSLGNYLGGLLADAREPRRILGPLFLLSALFCAGSPRLHAWVIDGGFFESLPWSPRVACTVAVAFLIPAMLLGTLSPIILRSLLDPRAPGRVIGSLFAAGSVGGIIGTYAAGFVLLPSFGTDAILVAVAGLLAAVGMVLAVQPSAQLAGAVMTSIFLVLAWVESAEANGWVYGSDPSKPIEYRRTSEYAEIRVIPRDRFDPTATIPRDPRLRIMLIDSMVHGVVMPEDPTKLYYGYEGAYAVITSAWLAARPRPTLSATFIGGGPYSFPRYLLTQFPKADVEVIEIDAEVTRAAEEAMGLAKSAPITRVHADARPYLARTAKTYDLVYGDAFSGFAVPWHLTTQEFDRVLHRILNPGGMYIVNVIDEAESERLVASMCRTLRSVFEYVALFAEQGRRRGRSTYVVVASDDEIVLPAKIDGIGRQSGFDRMDPKALDDRGIVLTDDFAPVESFMSDAFVLRQ